MATYIGVRVEGTCHVYRLDPPLCSTVKPNRTLSGCGKGDLEWGYRGAGPASLAITIIYDVTADADVTHLLYQRFKHDVVALLPRAGWIMESECVEEWIMRQIVPPVQPLADGYLDLGDGKCL